MIAPTSEARYRIQLNASAALKEKLDLARALISHSNAGGDLAVVIERALDVLIENVQKQRFAKTERPRGSRCGVVDGRAKGQHFVQAKLPRSGGAPGPQNAPVSMDAASHPRNGEPINAARKVDERRREHISNATRRAIVERDGLRCTFVSANGCRCEARSFLQVHHEKPWARGGNSDIGNLRLLCATHNQLRAGQDFGPTQIARQIAARRGSVAEPNMAGE